METGCGGVKAAKQCSRRRKIEIEWSPRRWFVTCTFIRHLIAFVRASVSAVGVGSPEVSAVDVIMSR